MTVKLFSTAGCAGCVVVKKLLDDKGIVYESFDVMDTKDMAEASKYNVRGIPTVVKQFDVSFGSVTGSTPKNIADIKEMLGV